LHAVAHCLLLWHFGDLISPLKVWWFHKVTVTKPNLALGISSTTNLVDFASLDSCSHYQREGFPLWIFADPPIYCDML
jgi:hypothetical protein